MASRPTRHRLNIEEAAERGFNCTTQKFTYETLEQARDGAEKAMDRGEVRRGCHVEPYICDECGHFHVGNRRIVFPKES